MQNHECQNGNKMVPSKEEHDRGISHTYTKRQVQEGLLSILMKYQQQPKRPSTREMGK